MAKQTTITLVDDVDGKPAAETIRFGLDGVTYEIDLSDKNAKALRVAVAPWVQNARVVGARERTRRTLPAAGESRSALIRAWAAQQGLAVPARGRIPADVLRQYNEAL
jgi:hypothetical protein